MVRLFSPTRASALSRSAAGPCRRFVPDPGVNVVGDEERMQPVKIAEARATAGKISATKAADAACV
jgi:hypothetical protein